MRTKLFFIVVFSLALCVTPCFGWGPDGHRIVAAIATTYLSDSAKAGIKDLLGDQTLPDIATWADDVRKDPAYDWLKPLHYINVPRDAVRLNMSRDCPNDHCVIGAINKYADILRDKNAKREDRILALKLIVHFVGDIHQPLHVSYGSDRGGNDLKVKWLGEKDWNLHGVWDSGLVEHRIAAVGDREALTKSIQKTITDRKLKLWRHSINPVDWANESLVITTRMYQQLPANAQLNEAYYKRNINTVEERLAMGGVRLAALLNDIFEKKDSDKPAETHPEIND